MSTGKSPRYKPAWLAVSLLLAAVAAYVIVEKAWTAKSGTFAPPPHSIAVLPFVNMSGDKDQEYFSEGLTEELLNSLSRINELQVAARTSSFSFQGEHPDLATVARKLNVASVLEGSVRRSGHTIRVTAQLNNATTGFHIWSQTYDRDLVDVLQLQAEIATAVAEALKITLLGDVAARIKLGGTTNPDAFDAYLRGLRGAQVFNATREAKDIQVGGAAYTEAIRLDPHFALAFAERSIAYALYSELATGPGIRANFDKAQADAHQAITLVPELSEGHLALATVLAIGSLDFTEASKAYERARALAPGNADALRESGRFAVFMGHFDAGLETARRAVVLDPLNPRSHYVLGVAMYFARRYREAAAAFPGLTSLQSDNKPAYAFRGLAYYGLGDLQGARASCETKPDYWASRWCLAVVYDKLGRHADAEAVLVKMKEAFGDASAYQYATIYAQWGNRSKALEWVDTALRVRDPALEFLKTDPLMDPLRNEPRFQVIERELKFPD